MIKFKICKKCCHKDNCLTDGLPSEEKLQALSNRKGGIWLDRNCPLSRDNRPERIIFT